MRKTLALLCCCALLCATATAQTTVINDINVVPVPVKATRMTGYFTLPKSVTIDAPATPELAVAVTTLKNRLTTAAGSTVTLQHSLTSTISLLLNTAENAGLGKEGYQLSVMPKRIVITANTPAGLFYGVQTLLQLFPPAIESKSKMATVAWKAPCVQIVDYPRFEWRGLMFDVARHFFTKEEVKHYIDDMVRYKFNILHLHLADDEGWRIEIKSLPKLTQVGAYSVKKEGYFGTFSPAAPNEPRNYGGFYTQDDIRELVKYAQARFVNIMPEIDVPGHSLAAVASYPELSCTPGADKYQVRSGEVIMDWSKRPPEALIDNTLCPANENVYVFLDKVMTEVAQLFPFQYIHVGGDECPKNFWEKSDAVKALMQRENLKTQEEVQSYFEKRLEKIVESKGKRFMGWDEILEGGLAPNAAVMSWRGMKGGIAAAKMKHDVVMSPTDFAYIDYMQGDQAIEPKVYATLRLNKAYQFEPVPDSVDARYIKGGQANLWTEQVYNMRHAEYMTYPRALAISESVWSPKANKSWPDFASRVQQQFKRLDAAEINYSPAVYDPIFNVTVNAANELQVGLSTEITGLDIYYSFDNTFPDRFGKKYSQTLIVPKDAFQMRVITYKGKEPVGRMINLTVEDMNRRTRRKVNTVAAVN
ncbi:beta-N-acetylhexosaminidase [Mucilaginibacter sp.]